MFRQLRCGWWYFFMLAEHYVKIAILIKNPKPAMSMQLNEMGAWFFLRMREWGIGRVGKFELGRAPLWEKVFFEFLGQENTKNGHLSLMRQRFIFPHELEWTKHFWETNLGIHVAASKQKRFWVWTFLEFPLSDDLNPSRFGFCVMIFPMFSHFISLSHFPPSASCFPE